MKTILVPTDFSPNADKALDFAVRIAKKINARIVLVHACDLLDMANGDRMGLKKEFNKNITRELNEKLSLYCRNIISTEGVDIRKKLYNDRIIPTLLYAINTNKADIVIMGTLGNAAAKEKIFGSTTARLIGKTDVPILAIPLLSEWKEPRNLVFTIKRFAEATKQRISPLIRLAMAFNASITVLKFSDGSGRNPGRYMQINREGNSFIEQLKADHPGIRSRFVHLEGGNFAKAIEKYIDENGIDLLTMIGHQYKGVNSLFHRSMAKKMSYHSSIPLLILPSSPVNDKIKVAAGSTLQRS